jgi:major membrane immunogen (membrane-anchored lipoprotein)
MKKAITLALVLILALSLLTACGSKDNGGTGSTGGNNSTPSTSQGGNDTTPSNNGGDSELANEWPKAIYDSYNVPAYTDGKIVCVDESPFRIPSAEAHADGSAARIADASFSKAIEYINALSNAGLCDNTSAFDADFKFFQKKESGSGGITINLSDGKNLQIEWWGYEPQKDFYYDSAEKQVEFTYNLEFFLFV